MFKKNNIRYWAIALIAIFAVLTFNVFSLFAVPFVAMALGADRKRSFTGGGSLYLRQTSASQVDTFSHAGHLGGTDLKDDHSMIEIIEEQGNLINAISGQRVVKIETILKQSSIDEINLIKNADGKYYDLYYVVQVDNGNYQELSAIPVKIKPGPTLSFKSNTERTIAVTIYLLAPLAAATRAPVVYNVTAKEPYVLIENAAAQGAPTEVTSVFATLISTVNA